MSEGLTFEAHPDIVGVNGDHLWVVEHSVFDNAPIINQEDLFGLLGEAPGPAILRDRKLNYEIHVASQDREWDVRNWYKKEEGTILVVDIGGTLPEAAEVRDMLSEEVREPMRVFVFWTPKGQYGSAPHVDTEGALIVPLLPKDWFFYPDLAQPGHFGGEVTVDDSTPVKVKVEPGTCMYIPRGVPHTAAARNEVDALHLGFTVDANHRAAPFLMSLVLSGSDVDLTQPIRQAFDSARKTWFETAATQGDGAVEERKSRAHQAWNEQAQIYHPAPPSEAFQRALSRI